MLEELAKINDQLFKMALAFCNDTNEASDIVQDTYIKLHHTGKEFKDITPAYIYFTMKSVFLDTKRKSYLYNRVEVTDFEGWNLVDEETQIEVKQQTPKLTNFEKLLIQALFGKEIIDKSGNLKKTKSVSMLKLSEETGIPYRTIYTNFQNIKKKWKESGM
jgi:DNA-directed RNA polymerase specialized sigma24 family protein